MNTEPTGYFSLGEISAATGIQGILNSVTSGVSLHGVMTLLNVVCTVYDVSQAVWQVINGEGSVMDIMLAVAKGAATAYVLGFICKSPLAYVIRPLFVIFGIGSQFEQLVEAIDGGDPVEVTIRFLQLVTMIYGVTQQCFTGETLVSTEDGLRRIEDIKVGDYVWSEDVETGEQTLQKVLSVSISQTDILVHVETSSGEQINTTTGHPFYVEERGWTIASELNTGDVLRTQEGEVQTVVSVTAEELDEPVLVYNLEVEDGHTYYVTDESVLVHNMCQVAKESGTSSNRISDYKEYDIVPYDNSKYRTPGFEKHHGVLNEWAEHNIPGYTKKNAPTILLSKEKHGLTKTVYQEWLRENYGKPVGISPDWGNMSKAEAMKLTNDMFDAANVPQNVRMEYFELFDIFITGG